VKLFVNGTIKIIHTVNIMCVMNTALNNTMNKLWLTTFGD